MNNNNLLYISLIILSTLTQGLLVFDQEGVLNSPCKEQVENVGCMYDVNNKDLLFGGVANKLSCLTLNKKDIQKECFFNEMQHSLEVITQQDEKACHDELHKKCGKQIDEFKKKIQDTSVIGTIKGAVDVVECLVNNAEDLWNKCKPFETASEQSIVVDESILINEKKIEFSENCANQVDILCPRNENKVMGLGYSLTCLVQRASVLGADCLIESISRSLNEVENSDDKTCHDEVRKKCGKQIDTLKKEIEETSVLGIVKAAVDVAECVASNAEDLWNKCKPFEEVSEQSLDENCVRHVNTLCPPTENKVTGLGFSLTCLTEHASFLSFDCVKQSISTLLIEMENSNDKSCHDEVRKKCGKQIDDLKKEIEKPSALGIVKAAVDVAQCIALSADDLWAKCKPFEDSNNKPMILELSLIEGALVEGAPTPKSTHKPTKKVTKSPSKSTTSKPTSKPTTKRIQDILAGGDVDSSDFQGEELVFESQISEVSTVDYDMSACIRSARKLCMYQVEEFNQSPFDPSLLENLNQCIEQNAALIESECIISSSSIISFNLPTVMYAHEPCRHPDDASSNLPICAPSHKCQGKNRQIMAVILGLFSGLILIKIGIKCCLRRRRRCNKHKSSIVVVATPIPEGYVALKTDDPEVPTVTGSIV